jgi:hypothetical protein
MWPIAGATIILRLILGVIITLLPLCSGGSSNDLSATGAWRRALPMMGEAYA